MAFQRASDLSAQEVCKGFRILSATSLSDFSATGLLGKPS